MTPHQALQRVIDRALSTVRSALGIQSPSKLYAEALRDWGKDFTQGLENKEPLTAEQWAHFFEHCRQIVRLNFWSFYEPRSGKVHRVRLPTEHSRIPSRKRRM